VFSQTPTMFCCWVWGSHCVNMRHMSRPHSIWYKAVVLKIGHMTSVLRIYKIRCMFYYFFGERFLGACLTIG